MGQQNDTGAPTAARQLDVLSPDAAPAGTPDDLSIFSGPALEVVFQWWLESNRRWTERDGLKALMPASVREAS